MCDYISWEQISVLLEKFSPSVDVFRGRCKELLEEINVSIVKEEVENDEAFKRAINLHRAFYAILQAKGEASNEVITSYRRFSVLSKFFGGSLTKLDLLRCPLDEMHLLVEEAIILNRTEEVENDVLAGIANNDVTEFRNVIGIMSEESVPLLL